MNLPPITRSLRFRLSGLTSALVFGVAGLALAGVYFVTLRAIQSLTVTDTALQGVLVNDGTLEIRMTQRQMRTLESFLREALLNKLAVWTIAIMLALFILSLIVGWIGGSRSLRPIDKITSVAQEIQATDLGRRIGLSGPDDELTRMANTFDAMLDRLEGSFQSQQRFLAHTSHDLRTPLAVIKSNLEVTAADPNATAEDWRLTGEVVERSVERVSVMVDDLLAVARTEMAGATFMPADVADMTVELVSALAPTAATRDIRLVSDVPGSEVWVNGDLEMLRRALANLVDNGVRASPDNGLVRVAVRKQGGWTYLAVIDQGPGIDPEIVANGDHGNGGLGLGIVRQIVAMHAGRVSALAPASGGSIVSIAVPDSPDPESPPIVDVGLPALYDDRVINDSSFGIPPTRGLDDDDGFATGS